MVEKAADISDTKKQEMITMMMREQTSMAMKINKEQTRQEELVCHNLQTSFTFYFLTNSSFLFYRPFCFCKEFPNVQQTKRIGKQIK